MTYYEKGEKLIQERHSKHGYSRETLDEQRWRRETPSRSPSEQKFERIVDDYRRTDYAYRPDDGFV